MIVLAPNAASFAPQGRNADITDGMQDDEEQSADQYQGAENPRPLGRRAQQVVQAAEVDHEHGGVDDGEVRDHQEPIAVLVQYARHLRRRGVWVSPPPEIPTTVSATSATTYTIPAAQAYRSHGADVRSSSTTHLTCRVGA